LAASADKNHARAVTFLRAALKAGTRFVLGRPVLIEYIDGVTKRVGKSEAIEQLRALEASAVMRIEPDVPEDHQVARDLFVRYDDHPIDLTDCLSFAIIGRLGLEEAFTFDRDFATHGLTCRPQDQGATSSRMPSRFRSAKAREVALTFRARQDKLEGYLTGGATIQHLEGSVGSDRFVSRWRSAAG